jgi:hypothetical protein
MFKSSARRAPSIEAYSAEVTKLAERCIDAGLPITDDLQKNVFVSGPKFHALQDRDSLDPTVPVRRHEGA